MDWYEDFNFNIAIFWFNVSISDRKEPFLLVCNFHLRS
jgi:hypothetical protein